MRHRSVTLPAMLALILAASFSLPAFADDDFNLHFTFTQNLMFNADGTGGPPFFDSPYNAVGQLTVSDVNPYAQTASIVGFRVEFTVNVCADWPCTKIVATQHYTARFDNTTAHYTLTNPNDPNSIVATFDPPGGTVHRTGGGKPGKIVFAHASYSGTPNVGYTLEFAFFSPEYKANITVLLMGP